MKQKKSQLAERLSQKIRRELGLECIPETFQRTYAGKNQKAQGAFVWVIQDDRGHQIGSIYPASDCIKKNVYLDYDPQEGEIFPESKEKKQ